MITNIRAMQKAHERDEIGSLYDRAFHSVKRYDNDGNIVGTFDRVNISITQFSGDPTERHTMAHPHFRMTDPTPERLLKAVRKHISLYYPDYAESNPDKTEVIEHGEGYKTTIQLNYERKGGWGWLHIDARLAYPYSAHITDPEISPISLIMGVD